MDEDTHKCQLHGLRKSIPNFDDVIELLFRCKLCTTVLYDNQYAILSHVRSAHAHMCNIHEEEETDRSHIQDTQVNFVSFGGGDEATIESGYEAKNTSTPQLEDTSIKTESTVAMDTYSEDCLMQSEELKEASNESPNVDESVLAMSDLTETQWNMLANLQENLVKQEDVLANTIESNEEQLWAEEPQQAIQEELEEMVHPKLEAVDNTDFEEESQVSKVDELNHKDTPPKNAVCAVHKCKNTSGLRVIEGHQDSAMTFACERHASQKIHPCRQCSKLFASIASLTRHLATHSKPDVYICEFCDVILDSQEELTGHMADCAVERCHHCFHCERTFRRRQDLMRHQRQPCAPDGYTCGTCHKHFRRKTEFEFHQRVHSGERPYVCGVCSKGHTTKSELNRHMRLHTGEGLYKCDQCDKVFNKAFNFKRHLLTHTDDKPYACEHCGKTFRTEYSLNEHSIEHNSDGVHTCQHCGKNFKSKHAFAKHVQSHDPEGAHKKKPDIPCDRCGKLCYSQSELAIHYRSHTGDKPFPCDVCGKRFVSRQVLKLHLQTHTGQRDHVCELCGAAFYRRTQLKRHMLQHTGEKPFKCKLCNAAFTRKVALDAHTAKHALMTSTGERMQIRTNIVHPAAAFVKTAGALVPNKNTTIVIDSYQAGTPQGGTSVLVTNPVYNVGTLLAAKQVGAGEMVVKALVQDSTS